MRICDLIEEKSIDHSLLFIPYSLKYLQLPNAARNQTPKLLPIGYPRHTQRIIPYYTYPLKTGYFKGNRFLHLNVFFFVPWL
jgi:hypothetical protein